MTESIIYLVGGVKIAALLLGSVVTWLAYRAYQRTQIEGLQYFALGLLVITIGTFLVGILHHIFHVPSIQGMLYESIIACVGFVVMIYGLYGQ
ncbi:DUF7521 family protein [Haloferax larsenii]|uniref:Uncharacterized protein n=1 Tax=Haloferax larsenii TaxID=302484 RepID=A0A1H7UJU3_HALLR|nr:hypothetical protein [Haloferax larsenii]ELZ79067.1 hypothetical protein C455_09288 [Haloferax larsenii JCM 13917]UVE52128.1 hypothetical protein KU306_16070 [Haloferax larsenii]SEL96985.1 hypothetical protein SAMN04488691_11315 [Haloferax larsenii]